MDCRRNSQHEKDGSDGERICQISHCHLLSHGEGFDGLHSLLREFGVRPNLLRMSGRTALTRATRQVASQLLPACLVAVLLSMLAAAQDLRYLRHGSWSTENGLPQD